MKRKTIIGLVCAFMLALLFSLVGCGDSGETQNPAAGTEYTIMYSDGKTTRQIKVKDGELYTINKPFPKKEGCEFLGLFDAEAGGTQYVNSAGMCVAPFTDKRNLVLFPQFKTQTITISLDYGKAEAGVGSLTVDYGQNLPLLPANLYATEGLQFTFVGWFTKPNCGGDKIADENGVSTVKAEALPLTDGVAKLYAGFEAETYKVVFYDCRDFTVSWNGYVGTPLYETRAEYGSKLSDVAPKTRANGQKILSWSAGENSGKFEGEIVSDYVFYVREYAVTVTYDTAGGEPLEPTVASNRESVSLKTPVKQYHKFETWKDGEHQSRGNGFFETDVTLTAEWTKTHYAVTYNIAGGETIAPHYVKTGESVPLPLAERRCYTLAGWVYRDTLYALGDELTMPANDITLLAQWNRISYLVTLINANGTDEEREVPVGESIVLPVFSDIAGYSFAGWSGNGNLYETKFTPKADAALTAIWNANRYTVTMNANGGTVPEATKTVVYDSSFSLLLPERNGYEFLGWYTSASGGSAVTGANAQGVSKWRGTSDTSVYAHWSKLEDITVSLRVQNCADENGYNPAGQAGEVDDRTRHNGFEIVKLVLSNVKKLDDGSYTVPYGNKLKARIQVVQDVTNLPINNNEASKKDICDDSFSGTVYGTNLNGKQIGKGAYYVCVTYTDGTTLKKNATNVLSGTKKGDYIETNVETDSSKKIKSVEVVVVYEMYCGAPGFLGIWWTEMTNWRCSAVLSFE